MRVLVLCLAIAAAVLAARVEPAQACSCVLGDPRAALARADAAFVGTLVERREPPGLHSTSARVTLVFRVERAVKGRLGRLVEVRTAAGGASCGIELDVGRRTGLFLDRDGSAWVGSLCGQVAPAALLDAARPLPAPTGRGPAALLVGGAFGPARTIALDRLGRTIAYGRGGGETQLLAVCPGARRVAEAVTVADGWSVAVRDVRTLRVRWSRRLPAPGATSPAALGCTDAGVFVFLANLDFPARSRLVRAGPAGVTTVWRGTAMAASFAGGAAFVNRGARGEQVARLDLVSRRLTPVARVPAWTGALVASPDGRLLAGVAYSAPFRPSSPPSRLVVVERAGGRVRTAPLGGSNVTGTVTWLDDGLAFFPNGEIDDARIYDRSLRVRSRLRAWRARWSAVADGGAYGVGWQGELTRTALPRGPVQRLRTLPSPVVHALVAVR